MHHLLGHTSDVRDLAFSADGLTLVTAGADGAVKAWNFPAIERRDVRRRTSDGVHSIAFQPAGPLFAFADDSDSVTLVDTRSGSAVLRIQNREDAKSGDPMPSEGLAFSSDGKLLAYSARDRREVHVFDVDRRAIAATLVLADERLAAIAFAWGDRELFTVSDKSRLTRWDLGTATQLTSRNMSQPEAFAIGVLASENLIATAAKDSIRLRNPLTLEAVSTLSSYPQPLRAIAISPDETLLAAGTTTGELLVWDLATRRLQAALVGYNGRIDSVAFSRDGTTIASCGIETSIRLWDVRAMQEVGSIPVRDHLNAVKFSPDGNTLAAGGARSLGGAVQFWSVPRERDDESITLVNRSAGDVAEYECLRDGRFVRQIDAHRDVTLDASAPVGASFTIADGSQASFQGAVIVGNQTEGSLTVRGQSNVRVQNEITVGRFQDSEGKLELVDHSVCESQGDIHVGKEGSGALHIAGGAVLRGLEGLVGGRNRGRGTVIVDGPESGLFLSDNLWVGDQGQGRLRVADGARVAADHALCIGARLSAVGTVTATGAGTVLATKSLVVGDYARGTLELSSGAVANVGQIEIAQRPESEGLITVEDPGTTLACDGACYIAGHVRNAGGQGTLTIKPGGMVNVAGLLTVYSRATINVDGGMLSAASVDLSAKSVIHYRSGAIDVQNCVNLNGVLRVDGPEVENVANGARIKVMTFGESQGRFASIEGPPGVRLEPAYSENGIDLIAHREP